eukprot:scaffold770_cov109-Cylindrotheca_fusiformis.AAC.7
MLLVNERRNTRLSSPFSRPIGYNFNGAAIPGMLCTREKGCSDVVDSGDDEIDILQSYSIQIKKMTFLTMALESYFKELLIRHQVNQIVLVSDNASLTKNQFRALPEHLKEKDPNDACGELSERRIRSENRFLSPPAADLNTSPPMRRRSLDNDLDCIFSSIGDIEEPIDA